MGGTPHKKMCSDIHTGVGTPHITPHTTQNQWGDTAQENVLRCSHWGGDDAEESKPEGGTLHKIKVGCWVAGWLGVWLAGWLGGWSNDYSANPGSILQAETCKILSYAENPR